MTTIHAERAHAPFSPSGAEIWMSCSGAYKAQAGLPDTSGKSAKAGTICHEVSEEILRRWHKIFYKTTLTTPWSHWAEVATLLLTEQHVEQHGMRLSDAHHIVMTYVRYIIEKSENLAMLYDKSEITVLIETKVDVYGEFVYGTLDSTIITPAEIEVIDLKSGSGKAVEAERNRQLLTYGVGILYGDHVQIPDNGGALKVTLTIVQPMRRDGEPEVLSWSTGVLTVADHMQAVERAVKKALDPVFSLSRTPGDHCTWCKAAATCPARHAKAIEAFDVIEGQVNEPIATAPADRVGELTPGQISEIMTKIPQIEAWLKAIKAHALAKPPPGWKVVAGRSNRTWADEAKVASVLEEANLSIDQFSVKKLIGITEAEKMLKIMDHDKLSKKLFIKPEGKPTLVPDTDPRPAVTPTVDFESIDD